MSKLQEIRTFPMRVEIEPTNKCNAHCVYCPRRFMNYKLGFMDIKLYKKLIDEISDFPDRTLVLFRRGEALLHSQFAEMLSYAKGKFKEIQLATNASLLEKKLAHLIADSATFISFSLELARRYQHYRQLDYATVSQNINYFLSVNKRAKTQVSMVKTDDITKEDIAEFNLQWSAKVDRVRIYEEHSRNGKFGSLNNPRDFRKPCTKVFNDILIFWDGQVGRCNHDWGECPLGNVSEKAIKDIWQSDVYDSLRRQHLSLDIDDEVCKKCDSWYEKIDTCTIGQVYEKTD